MSEYLSDEEVFSNTPTSKGGYLSDEEVFGKGQPAVPDPAATLMSTPGRTGMDVVKDTAISAGRGVIQAAQAGVGLANLATKGLAGRAYDASGPDLSGYDDSLKDMYSPAQQEANRYVEEAEGFGGKVGAYLEKPSTIAHGIVETIPSVLAGGAAGFGLRTAAKKLAPVLTKKVSDQTLGMLGGAAGEGMVGAGGMAEQVREQNEDRTLTGKQALLTGLAGIGTGIFGAVGGRLAQKLGVIDADTLIASGFADDIIRAQGVTGIAKRIVGGGIAEGVFEELPQSVQEQIWQNAATGMPLMEGVPESAASGMVLGTAMGGGMNAMPVGKKQEPKDEAALARNQAVLAIKQANIPTDDLLKMKSDPAALTTSGISPEDIDMVINDRNADLNRAKDVLLASGESGPMTRTAAMGINAEQAKIVQQREKERVDATRGRYYGTADPMAGTLENAANLLMQGGQEVARPQDTQTANQDSQTGDFPEDFGMSIGGEDNSGLQIGVGRGEGPIEPPPPDPDAKLPQDIAPAIRKMEQQLAESEGEGKIIEGQGNRAMVIGGYPATTPEWFENETARAYDKKYGTKIAESLKTATVKAIFKNMRKGKALPPVQAQVWAYLKETADDIQRNDPEIAAGNQFDKLNGEGFEFNAPESITAGSLKPGDEVVIEKNGVPDKLVFEKYDAKGNAVLKDGVTMHVDPFEQIQVIARKQGQSQITPAEEDFLVGMVQNIREIGNQQDVDRISTEIEPYFEQNPHLAPYREMVEGAVEERRAALSRPESLQGENNTQESGDEQANQAQAVKAATVDRERGGKAVGPAVAAPDQPVGDAPLRAVDTRGNPKNDRRVRREPFDSQSDNRREGQRNETKRLDSGRGKPIGDAANDSDAANGELGTEQAADSLSGKGGVDQSRPDSTQNENQITTPTTTGGARNQGSGIIKEVAEKGLKEPAAQDGEVVVTEYRASVEKFQRKFDEYTSKQDFSEDRAVAMADHLAKKKTVLARIEAGEPVQDVLDDIFPLPKNETAETIGKAIAGNNFERYDTPEKKLREYDNPLTKKVKSIIGTAKLRATTSESLGGGGDASTNPPASKSQVGTPPPRVPKGREGVTESADLPGADTATPPGSGAGSEPLKNPEESGGKEADGIQPRTTATADSGRRASGVQSPAGAGGKDDGSAEGKKTGAAASKERDGSDIERHKEFVKTLHDGKATVEEYRKSFESVVSSKDEVIAELSKMTKEQLFIYGGSGIRYRSKSEKKDGIVRSVYHKMLDDFNLGDSLSFTISGDYQKSLIDALRAIVNKQTQEGLEQYAQELKASREEYAAKVVKMKEGVEDPKTIDDFVNYLKLSIADGKTYAEARMTLTPEQRALYDALSGEKSRGERKARADQQRTDIRAASVTTEGQIVETKHTKTGEDLFVVKAAERVERDIYTLWNTTAKRMGGWYSSYRGGGAVPGFQFKSRENAEAFLKFIGGDVEQAKETVQARRDAYADDREQSAVERLREMSEAIENRAEDILSADRKTNTSKRARMAASAEAGAETAKALSKTMAKIADGIENGTVKFLDRVRQKVQVEMLRSMVKTAHYSEQREKYKSYSEQQRHEGEPPTAETADFAEYPRYRAFRSDLARLGRQLSEKDGTKKIGTRLLKVADDVTSAYVKFAKANLNDVAQYRTKDGLLAAFKSKPLALRSIDASGYNGKAIVLTAKPGEHMIILSPSEAKARGVWKGDDDKQITLSDDFGEEIVTKTQRKGIDIPWYFESVREKHTRLKNMGIETPQEFRAALREFISLQTQPAKPDKVKELERSMVGRPKDGLDFFPTPATVAQTMTETADIREGLSVLEPSAGMGHIAEVIRDSGVSPDVIEMSSSRRELLELKGFNVVGNDFLDFEGEYDRIVMNPPFSDRRDIEHVRHAYKLLKPGGRLVAIMGEGSFFGSDKKATAFRDWLEELNGTSEKLEEGTFLDKSLPVNTGVAARMVVIDKSESATEGDESTKLSKSSTPSQETADTKAELSAQLGEAGLQNLLDAGTVRLLTTQDQAKQIIARYKKRNVKHSVRYSKNGKIQGFTTATKAYLVQDGIAKGKAFGVLKHELGVHLQQVMLGNADFKALLASLEARQNEQSKTGDAIRTAMERVPKDTNPEHYWDEVLAYAVEMAPQAGIVRRFIALIKKALVKLGIDPKIFTAADLSALAESVLRREARGAQSSIPGKLASDPLPSFAGATAKQADKSQLAIAQQMQRDGAPRRGIWKKTGWYEIVPGSGQWSFEIDDSLSSVKMKDGYLEDVLTHPTLFKEYPQLGKVRVRFEDMGDKQRGSYSPDKRIVKVNSNFASKEQRSTLQHEVQHIIQTEEGFSEGGNARENIRGYASILKDLEEQVSSINDSLKNAIGTPKYQFYLNEREYLVDEIRKIEGDEGIVSRGMKEYATQTGEAEARLVQARLDLPPAKRKIIPPWVTLRRMLEKEGLLKDGQKIEDVLVSSQSPKGSSSSSALSPAEARGNAGPGGDVAAFGPVDVNSAGFKRWFKGSKVVDADGKPLRVYHGTRFNFSVFDGYEVAGWFSVDPSLAGERYAFGESEDSGANIIPVYLDIKNPKKLEGDMDDADENGNPMFQRVNYNRYVQELIKQGYDGIEVNENGVKTFAAFSSSQVKSSISNTGSYSDTDNRLMYSIEAAEAYDNDIQESAGTFYEKIHDKPDMPFLAKIFSTPEYNFKNFPATWKMFNAQLDRHTEKFNLENSILGDFVSVFSKAQKESKAIYEKVKAHLLDVDASGKSYRLKHESKWEVKDDDGMIVGYTMTKREGEQVAREAAGKSGKHIKDYKPEKIDTWTVIDPKGAEGDQFLDEQEAVEAMEQAEYYDMINAGSSKEEAGLVRRFRRMTNLAFDHMIADLRKIIKETDALGLPEPTVDIPDESRRYVIVENGAEIGDFTTRADANAAIKIRRAADQLKGGRRATNLEVKKRSDGEIKKTVKLSEMIAMMSDLRGQYFPRQRQPGGVILRAVKGDDKIMEKFDLYITGRKHIDGETGVEMKRPMSEWLRKRFNEATGHIPFVGTLEKRARQLRAQGYDVTVEKDNKTPESVFDVVQLSSSIDALLREAVGNAKKDKQGMNEAAAQEINKILTANVADLFKARGYLSSRLKRTDDYWKGFEEDPLLAGTQYARGIASGIAKRNSAKNMMAAMTGRDQSWAEYKLENPEGTWEEYDAQVEAKRLDPNKQPILHKEALGFMEEVLRNEEQIDRIVGTMKGLAVIKFLGFRVSSAMVNATNMLMGVPASISSQTGGSMTGAFNSIRKAAIAYGRYRAGRELSEEDRSIFLEITNNGWDQAQFNQENAAVLMSKLGRGWNKFGEWSMAMFGAVEKANRAMSIFAAYKEVRANTALDHNAAMEKAKHISDRAHGVYGKATLPAWARGSGNPLKLTYTFQKFSHNYMLNMIEMGLKGDKKQAAYMVLSPALMGGAGATLVTPLVAAFASALGAGDDPEEEFYDWVADTFGSDSIARHGIPGALGINLKGSIEMNNPIPTTMAELFGAPQAIIKDALKAGEYAGKGELMKAGESLLPTAVGSAIKAAREGREGLTTGSYSPVFYGDEPLKATTPEQFVRALSFNPSRISGIREKQWHEKQVAAKYNERRSEIIEKFKRYYLFGKGDYQELMVEYRRYNELMKGSGRNDITLLTIQSIKRAVARAKKPNRTERLRQVQDDDE